MNDFPIAYCFTKQPHAAHQWGQYQGDKYTKECPGVQTLAEAALERRLVRARVSAFLTAPSWTRHPYAGMQAEQIIALVLDTESCKATSPNPGATWIDRVCYREKGHDHSHMDVGGGAPWDDDNQDEIDKSIEEHDRFLDATLEDR